MLIKRVVIQGFKTFAKKTEFVFDPGVTAIVGPNGSGKSNVVDAIRWCMGEQSFSLLRSKKTSDVIFSGSDQRSRLGMAQVSLTLDNSNGELPVDFAEVEITRRAYRDGDNEYLLNGQRVRLQDTTEILAQTGLGRRTYALIGQGLIDRVLSLAPDQLRALFEEAAGITSYQVKRSTTLRRLDATQQNLTRVKDIVAELSPRLRYLRRQAERATEREQIASDLRGLLRDWYGYHWHATLKDLERKHLVATGLEQRVQSHHQQMVALNNEIGELRNRQSQLRSTLSELHGESSDRHRQAERVSRDLAVAQERLRQVQARGEESRRELAPLRLQNETLLERLAASEQTILSLTQIFEERQNRVNSVQTKVTLRQRERTQLQTELADTRRTMADLQQRLSNANSRLDQLQERVQTLHREKDTQTSAVSVANSEAVELASALEAAYSQVAEQQNRASTAREEIEEMESRILACRTQLDETGARRQQIEREVDRLQTRLELLNRLHNEGAGYASGVRAVLSAAKQRTAGGDGSRPRLSGIIGTLASLIQVPPSLDKAVETALGGAFQHLVTESWSDAHSAIEYLKQSGHGRATFLPLDRLRVPRPIPAPELSGILGNAADLVQYEPSVTDAVHYLLNRTWIAENLGAARTALDSLAHTARPTVVTLDGEIVRAGGAVTGGSDRTRRDDSILAREREMRELPSQIEKASARLNEIIEQSHALMSEIKTISVQKAPLQDHHDRLLQLESEIREKAEELRRQHDRALQSEGWHSQRVAEIDKELAANSKQDTELRRSIQQLTQDLHEIESRVLAAEMAEEAAGAGDLLRQLADLRADAAEAQGSLQSQQTLLESQQRSHQQIANQIGAKERHIADLDREAEDLSHQIQKFSRDEEDLSNQIKELKVQIEPSEAALTAFEVQQTELESRERGSQEALRKDESAWNGAQLRWQRANDRLAQLRHDIEQDLGLVFLEESEELAYQPPLPWDAIVEQLPVLHSLPPDMEEEVREMRARLSRVNNVNPDAPREYAEAAGRYEHLLSQSEDLEAAIADMRKVLEELDAVMEGELRKTFAAVAEQFVHYFQVLFRGGTARLVLADPDNITSSGIEIVARPPGKRPTSLALLSGGERSLAACALIFAILRVSPTPFCVLDEVDAALDETNVDRFREALEELSSGTQFIIITHNRRTLEGTNAIYGITMGNDGTSRVISLRLDDGKVVRQAENTVPAQLDIDSTDDDMAAIEDLVTL